MVTRNNLRVFMPCHSQKKGGKRSVELHGRINRFNAQSAADRVHNGQ
jgi:hypothetical protein